MHLDVGVARTDSWRVAVVERIGLGSVWAVTPGERDGLNRGRVQELITDTLWLRLVSATSSLRSFVDWAREAAASERPHILILDLDTERGQAPNPQLIKALADLRIQVVALSAMAAPEVLQAVLNARIGEVVGRSGADGDILSAIGTLLGRRRCEPQATDDPGVGFIAASGSARPRLSLQEERTLNFYGPGLTLPAVAGELGVGLATANT